VAVSPPGSLPRLAWLSSALSGPLHLAHARENVTEQDATPRRGTLGLSLRCPAGRCTATSPEDCCGVQFVTITVFFLSQSKPSRVGRICSMQGQRQVTVSDVGCPTLRQLAGAVQTIGGPDAPHTSRKQAGCTRSRLKGHSTQRRLWIGASYVAGAGDHGRPRPAKTRSRNGASVIGRYRRASPIAGSADGVRCQWPKKRRSSGARSHVSPVR